MTHLFQLTSQVAPERHELKWQRRWVAMRTQQGAATRAYGAIDRALTHAGQGAGKGSGTRTGMHTRMLGTGTCKPHGRVARANLSPGDMISPGDVNLSPGGGSSPPMLGRCASLPTRHALPSGLGAVTQRVRSAASFDRLGAGARLALRQRAQALHLPPNPHTKPPPSSNPNPNPDLVLRLPFGSEP